MQFNVLVRPSDAQLSSIYIIANRFYQQLATLPRWFLPHNARAHTHTYTCLCEPDKNSNQSARPVSGFLFWKKTPNTLFVHMAEQIPTKFRTPFRESPCIHCIAAHKQTDVPTNEYSVKMQHFPQEGIFPARLIAADGLFAGHKVNWCQVWDGESRTLAGGSGGCCASAAEWFSNLFERIWPAESIWRRKVLSLQFLTNKKYIPPRTSL